MLRQVVLMTCVLAAAPALGQSRTNGLEGLSESIQRDYDAAIARSRTREIVTAPLPPRDNEDLRRIERRLDAIQSELQLQNWQDAARFYAR